MNKIIYPITQENFSDAWGYANSKLTEMKKKNAIRSFLKLFANITLFTSSTTLIAELLFKNGESIIYQPDLPIAIQLVIYLGILFIPPIAVSALIALLIWFIYNPKIQKNETGDKQIDSKELFHIAKELSAGKELQKGIITFLGGILFIIKILYSAFLFGMNYLNEKDIIIFESTIDAAFTFLKPYLPFILLVTAVVLLLTYGFYMLLCVILNLLLRPLYETKVNTSLRAACENYYYLNNPEAKELKEKENNILLSSLVIDKKYVFKKKKELTEDEVIIQNTATEIKEKQRLERIELSEKVSFKSPVSNILKITAVMLPLIFVILPIVKTINMNATDFYNNFGVVYITPSTSTEELEEMDAIELLQNDEENIAFQIPIEEFKHLTFLHYH